MTVTSSIETALPGSGQSPANSPSSASSSALSSFAEICGAQLSQPAENVPASSLQGTAQSSSVELDSAPPNSKAPNPKAQKNPASTLAEVTFPLLALLLSMPPASPVPQEAEIRSQPSLAIEPPSVDFRGSKNGSQVSQPGTPPGAMPSWPAEWNDALSPTPPFPSALKTLDSSTPSSLDEVPAPPPANSGSQLPDADYAVPTALPDLAGAPAALTLDAADAGVPRFDDSLTTSMQSQMRGSWNGETALEPGIRTSMSGAATFEIADTTELPAGHEQPRTSAEQGPSPAQASSDVLSQSSFDVVSNLIRSAFGIGSQSDSRSASQSDTASLPESNPRSPARTSPNAAQAAAGLASPPAATRQSADPVGDRPVVNTIADLSTQVSMVAPHHVAAPHALSPHEANQPVNPGRVTTSATVNTDPASAESPVPHATSRGRNGETSSVPNPSEPAVRRDSQARDSSDKASRDSAPDSRAPASPLMVPLASLSSQEGPAQAVSAPAAKPSAYDPVGASDLLASDPLDSHSAAALTSPVQLTQMMRKAALAEMQIGFNTSAFGSVQVRTVVRASEVGVSIGSEKGDLRSLLADDIPVITHTLQQQDLRLTQVNFQQQGFGFAGDAMSNGNSQPQGFAHKANASALPISEFPAVETEGTAEPVATNHRNLSILA